MKLEDLCNKWEKDCKIDATDLAEESLKIAKLHSQYYQLYLAEKRALYRLQQQHKALYKEKWEFYMDGPSKEQIEKGWELPPKGKIIRNDIEMYLEADIDIIKSNLSVSYQKDKVEFLKDIIASLNSRNWNIRNAIEFHKFISGA